MRSMPRGWPYPPATRTHPSGSAVAVWSKYSAVVVGGPTRQPTSGAAAPSSSSTKNVAGEFAAPGASTVTVAA